MNEKSNIFAKQESLWPRNYTKSEQQRGDNAKSPTNPLENTYFSERISKAHANKQKETFVTDLVCQNKGIL